MHNQRADVFIFTGFTQQLREGVATYGAIGLLAIHNRAARYD